MKLYEGLIAWKTSKQAIVTTSSTEAALSETTKKAMFLRRPFDAIELQLFELLTVHCDNIQTLDLMR